MEYREIIVQSVWVNERGKPGSLAIMPLPNQEPYYDTMYVQCSKAMSSDYPVGTKFKIKAKIIQPTNGDRPFVSTHYTWPYEVVEI